MNRRVRPVPWRANDVITLAVALTIGFGLLLLSFWGTSGTPHVPDQVPWINVGVVGLMTIGTGHGIWLLNCRRALGERREQVLEPLRQAHSRSPVAAVDVTAVDLDAGGPTGQFVAADGMARYHRGDCQLVADKPVEAADEDAHRSRGRRPCGMCLA